MDAEGLARIEGYLKALETLNNYTNHIATYEIVKVQFNGDVPSSLEKYLAHWSPILVPVPDWKTTLPEVITRWSLTLECDEHQSSGRAIYHSSNIRRSIAEQLMTLLLKLFRSEDLEVWELQLKAIDGGEFPYYHIAWQDYVFHADHALYLLHLAVDD